MKGKFSRKLIACVCSLALAGALVPAMALSAFAEGDAVFTVYAQEIGSDDSTRTTLKAYTAEDIAELAVTGQQSNYVINAKGSKVYSTKYYVELWDLLNFEVWDEGAYFKALAGEEGVYTKNGPYAYNNMTNTGYFWSGQTGWTQDGEPSKYTSGKLVSVEPVIALTAVKTGFGDGTNYETAGDAANGADFNTDVMQNVILMGNTEENLQAGTAMPGNSACTGTTGLVIYYPHNLDTATATVSALTYNGKNQTAKIALKDASGATVDTADYRVMNNTAKKPGVYYAYVYGAEKTGTLDDFKSEINYQDWSGYKGVKYTVNMSKISKVKTSVGKKKVTVKWTNNGASKYKVSYKVKGAKKWKTKTVTKNKITIKKLTKGKKYKIKVVGKASGVSKKTSKTVTTKAVK